VTGELTDDLTTHVGEPDMLAAGGRRRGTGMLPLVVVLVLLGAAILTQRRFESAATASFNGGVLAAPPHALVAQLSTSGGLEGQALLSRLYPPQLAVYADGTAVMNASKLVRLTPAEVNELVSGLRVQLAGYRPRLDPPAGARRVLDAPDVTMGVYDSGRMRSVTASALGPDTSLGYPARLVAAYKRFDTLLRRIERDGKAYGADGIRVLLVPSVDLGPPPRPWPAGVPLPPVVRGDRAGIRDGILTGKAAAALLEAWPVRAAAESGGVTSQPSANFRLPDGQAAIAQWRYLLPSEPRR
jgi:hypothetical protein